MKTAPNEKLTKTIVLVGGDKGGVGKSTMSRVLVEYYAAEKTGFIGYDGDDVNPTLSRFFKNAEPLHTKLVKGLEPLINNLESDTSVQVVDLGAGTQMVLNQFSDQTGFLEVARQNGAKVTLLFMLAPSVESIGLLKVISEFHGDNINYVVVRNNAIPGTWDLWESSKIREKLLKELDAKEITMPLLDPETYSAIDRSSFTFGEASKSKDLPLALRSHAFRWTQKMFQELNTIKTLIK